jgi:UDP-N-acetyl-D-glucosamine dehydrogenase
VNKCPALWERAIAKFNDRSARVGILGLGYAGLPLACCFAEAGFQTLGFDIDRSKIEQLSAGWSYIGHIPVERIAGLVKKG